LISSWHNAHHLSYSACHFIVLLFLIAIYNGGANMPGAMGWLDLIVFLLKPTAPGHDLATCYFRKTPKATRVTCGANYYLRLQFGFVSNFLAQFPPFKPTSAPFLF
jgi:hypothetical protein